MVLGPNADIVRNPWWGRVGETESEDPLLTARIVDPYVRAGQARNVIVGLKHYNLYTQETNRANAQNAIVDERTVQEIYTPAVRGRRACRHGERDVLVQQAQRGLRL